MLDPVISRFPTARRLARHVSRRIGLTVLVSIFVLLFGSLLPVGAAEPFYIATQAEIAGKPGTLIRIERYAVSPAGATAYRVLYRSRGLNGEPIAVSGAIIVPDGPVPVGGRRVVAWAHPTSGVVSHCAPSLAYFLYDQIHGLHEMIARGYVVAATDYPGVGTPGPHPYLVGTSEARAVLDSVRAAAQVPGVGPVRDFAVWGHSQGGQAALFTGIIAHQYAPDLLLRGVAAAAPATDLATLMRDDFATPGGKNLAAMAIWSWARVYGAPANAVIEPDAMATVDALANVCIESLQDILLRGMLGRPLARAFLTSSHIFDQKPWRSLLVRNSPGTLPRNAPLFLAQGTADTTVRPQVTFAYMRKLCAAGNAVELVVKPGAGHAFIARDTEKLAVDWIADRFAGRPAPSDCARQASFVEARSN